MELGSLDDQACLVIFDRFKAQCTATVLGVLEEYNILVSLVPANCTDRLQPLDVSVNKSKNFYVDSSMNGMLLKCPSSCKVARK